MTAELEFDRAQWLADISNTKGESFAFTYSYKAVCSEGFDSRLVAMCQVRAHIIRWQKLKKLSAKSAGKYLRQIEELQPGESLWINDCKYIRIADFTDQETRSKAMKYHGIGEEDMVRDY